MIAIVLAGLDPPPADACDCGAPQPTVTAAAPALPPDGTLYVFVPDRHEMPELEQDHVEVWRSAAGTIHRIDLHDASPGDLAVEIGRWDPIHFTVDPALPPMAAPRLVRMKFIGPDGSICTPQDRRFEVEIEGDRAAAYRMSWRIDGSPRVAFLPVFAGAPGNHVIEVGTGPCATSWLDPERDGPFDDLELTMLTVDGKEVVVARGPLTFHDGGFPTFVSEAATLAPHARPPPPTAAPPTAFAWWGIAAAVASALLVGALIVWLVLRRRRAT